MACERIHVQRDFKDCNTYDKNCIIEIVKKIIQQQKQAEFTSECDTCESPLFAQIYNTRPVTFYLANGAPFTVVIPGTTEESSVFRIEYLRGDCATLRIIKKVNCNYVCTDYTAVLNLTCVCGLQCFPPICCEECGRGCTVERTRI